MKWRVIHFEFNISSLVSLMILGYHKFHDILLLSEKKIISYNYIIILIIRYNYIIKKVIDFIQRNREYIFTLKKNIVLHKILQN